MKTRHRLKPSAFVVAAACSAAAAGCATDEGLVEDRAQGLLIDQVSDVADADDEDSSIEPAAVVELDGGSRVLFFDGGDADVSVVSDVPDGQISLIDEIIAGADPTPLELFLALTNGEEAPQVLWDNHMSQVESQDREDSEPQAVQIPRFDLPTSGSGVYTTCNSVNFDDDWRAMYQNTRDVEDSVVLQKEPMYNVEKRYYAGGTKVQRANFGLCTSPYGGHPSYTDQIKFRMNKDTGTFNYGCGNASDGWSQLSNYIYVSEDRAYNYYYYYAGYSGKLVCAEVRIGSTYIPSDSLERTFGVAVAYDYPLGVGP